MNGGLLDISRPMRQAGDPSVALMGFLKICFSVGKGGHGG